MRNCLEFRLNSNFLFENEKIILQEYLNRPLVYQKRKVDFRAYLIVYSLMPLRIEVVNGFGKIAGKRYSYEKFSVIYKFVNFRKLQI